MGAAVSNQQTLNQTINNIQTKIMLQYSESESANVNQDNTMIIGNGNTISGTDSQSSASTINMSMVVDSTSLASFQNDLSSAIGQQLSAANTGNLGVSVSNQKIQNIVTTNINNSYSMSTVQKIQASVSQANNMQIGNDNKITGTNSQSNVSSVIQSIQSTVSSSILQQLGISDTTKDTTTAKNTADPLSFISGLLDSVMLIPILIILFFLGIFGGAWKFFRGTMESVIPGENKKRNSGIATIIAVVVIIAIYEFI